MVSPCIHVCAPAETVGEKENVGIPLGSDRHGAEFTAEGTADILVSKYIPLWGCHVSLLSDNGLQFCSKLSPAIYKLHGMRKIRNPAMQNHLLGAGDRLLTENSPYDTIWGIGYRADHENANCSPSWRGLNLLGKTLQIVNE